MARKPKVERNPIIPANTFESNTSLFRIGSLERRIDGIEAGFTAEVERLRKEADTRIAGLLAERENRIAGLEIYVNENRNILFTSDRRLVEFSGGTFGWRWTPPKVTLARGGEKKSLETLKRFKLKKYIRVKESIDRESLLRDRPEVPGITYTQREEFYVKPKIGISPEASENVVVLAVAAV